MASRQVSLWLTPLPTNSTQQRLRTAIQAAAAAHAGPVFDPHITLHTIQVPSHEVSAALEKIKQLAASVTEPVLPCAVSGLKMGSTRHQSVLLEILKTDKLVSLKKEACSLFGGEADSYYPHISVWYGEDVSKRQAAHDHLASQGLAQLNYEVAGIDVVFTDGPEERWAPLARFPLATKHMFRMAQFIDGQWVGSSDKNSWIPVVDPATKKIFHCVPSGTSADIDAAVAAAHRALPGWRATPASERARLLTVLAEKIAAKTQELAEYETLDNGKPLKESVMDVGDVVACFNYYAAEILRVEKEEDNSVIDVQNSSIDCRIQYAPVGVCGLVIPWNYPLLMAAWKIAPCLAAGCTAILKPSEMTPVTALELAALAADAGIPAGVLNVVNGFGPNTGAPLSSHPLVAKVAFTGSVPTGVRVMQSASSTMKNVTLELGGKSPIIVFEDADLEQVVDWCLLGIFFNQGQVCSATSRLIVHSSIKDKLVALLVENAKKIKLGSGMDSTVEMGPIVSETQYNRVLGFISDGIHEGALLLTGGEPTEDSLKQGYFVLPTIFDNVKSSMKIWKEEIFGPVLCVHSFDSEEEALKLANETHYGLAAAVMSTDKAKCDRVVRALDAGIVWVNCSQPTFVQAPWGGMKQSGHGRELGPWGLKNYLEVKQVTAWVDTQAKNWGWYAKN